MRHADWLLGRARGAPGLAIAVVFAIGWPTAAAWADPVPAGFSLDIEIDQGASTWTGDEATLSAELDSTTSGDQTTVELTAPKSIFSGGATIQSWVSTYDLDPFITNDFVVVNNSGVTQTYNFSVSTVIPALLAGTIVQSNIILTINDNDNANGATVSSVLATSVYDATVNGTTELTFLDDPFSNSCTSPFDCTFNGLSAAGVASQAFGPVVATSIGISITFDLSAGDSAAVQSRFEIVPEPGTAALLALGLLSTAILRRRVHARA